MFGSHIKVPPFLYIHSLIYVKNIISKLLYNIKIIKALVQIDITYDNQYLVCNSDYPYELQLLKNFLTREISNAWLLKKKMPYINTERCFMNEYGMVPVGLWLEVLQFCKQFNISANLTENTTNYINQFQLDYQAFPIYIDDMFKDAKMPIYDTDNEIEGYKAFKPYEYQIKAAYTLLKYRKACGEISTSAGKTLISFMIFKYLIDMGVKKILYIVPSVDLATQSAEKYELYESYLAKHKHNWEIGILHAGLKKAEKEKVESCNILFGTFQSLNKRDEEFFKDFGAVIGDECLHPDTLIMMGDGTTKKIKDIIPGDLVYTYNELTKEKEILPVKKVYKNLSKSKQMYEITTEDNNIIKITGNHKVLTSNRGYVRADKLTLDDDIISF